MDPKRSETLNVLIFGYMLGILECLIPPTVRVVSPAAGDNTQNRTI